MSEVLRTVKKLADGSADVLGVFGGLSALAGNLKKVTVRGKAGTAGEKQDASTETPQHMPGAFGLSLEDERIFNGVLCQLKVKHQLLITDFLAKKCKNFQRRRFIEVVSGLQVEPGSPERKERVWDSKAKKSTNIAVPAVPGKDRRQEFLQKFAEILADTTKASKAFDYVVGARTILKDSPYDMLKEEAKDLKKMRAASKKRPGGYKDRGFFTTAFFTWKRR
jgi:hypothetical protein